MYFGLTCHEVAILNDFIEWTIDVWEEWAIAHTSHTSLAKNKSLLNLLLLKNDIIILNKPIIYAFGQYKATLRICGSNFHLITWAVGS